MRQDDDDHDGCDNPDCPIHGDNPIDLEAEAVVILLTNRCHQVAKYSRFELRPIVHDLVREAFDEG